MIDRARIARLDVSVVSTQRGSVWSVRNGQWWIPEPTIPSQCRVGNFFRKFDPSGRFSGIFLDFFQIFFGGRRHVPSVSRATHRADAIRDQPLAEMRCSCGSRPFVANGNAAPPQTSENPIPVTVCGFSTAAPEVSLCGRFCPFGAGVCVHFASSTSVVDDVGWGGRTTSSSGVEGDSIALRNAEMLAFVAQTYSDG